MRAILTGAARSNDVPMAAGAAATRRLLSQPQIRRVALALLFSAGVLLVTCAQASAFTLKLVFPDGKPMTYGSACTGAGCLQRGNLATTDANGEVVLRDNNRTIEYRRDGITIAEAAPGAASGRFVATTDALTIVMPRLLLGSAPAVDATEADLTARLNDHRANAGLPRAQVNTRLSAAADYQASWLTSSGVLIEEPERFHEGPFGTTFGFRLAEVSFPDPNRGAEVVEAGGTPAEAVQDWMSSAPHRAALLAPGPQLMGVAQVGGFIVVNTHPPCAGCDSPAPIYRVPGPAPAAPPAAPAPAPGPAPAPPPPPAAAAASTSGGSTAQATPPCGSEVMRVRRLRNQGRRVRLRIQTSCLRRGSIYSVLVRQGATGRQLASRSIRRAGLFTLSVRPSRRTTKLRIKLKRDGRALLTRSLVLRR